MSCFYGIDEAKIREYARLIACTGINVQKGQEIILNCPVEYYEFGRMVIEELYAAGAGEVVVRWNDTFDSRQYYLYASEENLATVPDWKAESFLYYTRRGAGYVSIAGSDPEAYKGVDPKRMQIRQSVMNKALAEHYKLQMASEIPWTVAAVPQQKWAAKVFPERPVEEAMARLWELILKAVRIGDGDAVQAWADHDAFLKSKCKMLNDYGFEKLHY